jgi:RNA polymerase sigma-70 factor (ECF subfamily)
MVATLALHDVAFGREPALRRAHLRLVAGTGLGKVGETPDGNAVMANHAALKKELVALLPRLRRFAISLTRNVADADDLVQEACIKAIQSAASWDPTQGLDRWVFRILRNQWISETRKRGVRLGEGQVDAAETDELRHEATGEHHLAMREIMGRLAALPSGFSEVLLLVAVEGYSYAEAAEMLNIPQGTVMSRIHRARQLLAEELQQRQVVR